MVVYVKEERRQKGRNGEGKAVMYIVSQTKGHIITITLADVTSFVTFVNELWRKQELKLKNIAVIASGHNSRTYRSTAGRQHSSVYRIRSVRTKTRQNKNPRNENVRAITSKHGFVLMRFRSDGLTPCAPSLIRRRKYV